MTKAQLQTVFRAKQEAFQQKKAAMSRVLIPLAISAQGGALAATSAGSTIGTIFGVPAKQICGVLTGLTTSPIVGVIAFVLIVAAIGMFFAKMRGAIGMGATGVVGFFLVKNSVAIAGSFLGITCGA